MLAAVKEVLGNVCTVIDCEHKTAPTQDEGIPLIRTPNIGAGHLILDNAKRITEQVYAAWTRRAKPEPGDLIMAREAPVGNVALIRKGQRVCLGQRTVLLRLRDKRTSPHYLNYLLNSPAVNAYVNLLANGATVGHLNVADIRKLSLPRFPSKMAQERIAAILSAYDDLIENNRRRIALLEKMAEEIYREWFVRMRFPGHERAKFEKGVPEGWSVKRFHEIVEYYIGGGWGEDNQSASFCEGAVVIRGTDIPDVQAGDLEGCPFRFHQTSNLKSRKLQPNDIVFEVSGGSKNQLLGRNVLVTERVLRFFDAPVIAASFCKLIRFRQKLVSPYFMKYFLKLYYDYDLVGIYQVQSTGISNYQFESFLKFQTIVLPPSPLQQKFEEKVKPIIEMRDDVALANITLRKARDSLLPRLISGKLDVEKLDIQFPSSMLNFPSPQPSPGGRGGQAAAHA
jgi:type I restriction enzyme S subunit